MGRINCGWSLVLVLFLFGWTFVCSAQDIPSPPSAKEIAQWIVELNDESFSVREAATRRLILTGPRVIAAAAEAAREDQPEVTERSLRVLSELGFSTHSATAEAAIKALVAIAESDHKAASRARRFLRSRQDRVIEALVSRGITIELDENEHLTDIYFSENENFKSDLSLLRELPDLAHISASASWMDDEALVKLQGLPKLREFNLFQSRVGDAGLEVFKTLPSLRRVPMGLTKVTDKGLVHLKDLTNLEYIGLRGNAITDAGLVHLQGLKNLTGLHLGETKVTDAGLVHLRGLTKLTMLRLEQTAITDAGIEHLLDLKDLHEVNLSQTRVTAEGRERLLKAIPGIQISRQAEP